MKRCRIIAIMKTCSIDSCDDPILARGWCRKHYLRWYKHDDVNHKFSRKENSKKGQESHLFIHGFHNHPSYSSWWHMIDRCMNLLSKNYKNWGGRGITVCERWKDINNFISDMGEKPFGFSIERIDVNGNYTPENCIWIENKLQSRNRRCLVLNKQDADNIRSECRRRTTSGYSSGLTREQLAKKYKCSIATIKKVLDGGYWE